MVPEGQKLEGLRKKMRFWSMGKRAPSPPARGLEYNSKLPNRVRDKPQPRRVLMLFEHYSIPRCFCLFRKPVK